MEPILEIRGLTKRYGNGRGASGISLQVEPGQIVGILGPNGSGKTTIMKSIVGFCSPDEGIVRVCGVDALEHHAKAMESVGALIEQPAFYGHLTARENLELAARFYPHVDAARIDRVLEAVRLKTYRKDQSCRFSLGMKQRLGIALALLSDPKLVLLDEPTNGLDIEGTVEIREILARLAQEKGVSFLIASHLAGELEKICTHAVILADGAMIPPETVGETGDGKMAVEDILRLAPTLEDYYLSRVRENRAHLSL